MSYASQRYVQRSRLLAGCMCVCDCMWHVSVNIDACYRHAVLALWLLCNAGTIGDQQVHHGVGADEDSRCRCHAAATDAAAAQRHCAIRCSLSTAAAWRIMGTHVALQLREGLAVHATQMAH